MAKSRFIVPDLYVCKSFGVPAIIILVDLEYWNQHYDELEAWCRDTGARMQGMTVDLPSLASLTAFVLRWT